MDAVVGFLRNALCCIKDWNIFPDTVIYDATRTNLYYNLPEPLNETTPLEVFISIFQLYALVSCSLAGLQLMTSMGIWKLKRINNLIEARATKQKSSLSEQIVDASLEKERAAAKRTTFVGTNIFCIGVSFFWLFANSWQVTSTDWIGGLAALIHALTVMEVALIVLLYYMLKDASDGLIKSKKMKIMADDIRSSGGLKHKDGEIILTADTYEWVVKDGWSPFWSESAGPSVDPLEDIKLLNKESAKVFVTVDALLTTKPAKNPITQSLEDAPHRLEVSSWMARMEGYREYLYFVLNLVAFYGYFLGVLCYYFDDDETQPFHVGKLKFGLKTEHADWHGNFAGDFMWTIEPVVILVSPIILNHLKPKAPKAKLE